MGLIRAFKSRYQGWGLGPKPPEHPEGGIALFMVMAAVSVLSILVTEFTYVAQVNQKMAFDGVDQLKAHYLAKTGLKISLLRLKAFQNITQYANGLAKAAGASTSLVPKAILDQIWSFPFFYPFPTNIPGMSTGDKERIEAFQKASGLDGRFSSVIESESSKYNLNMLLAGYAPPPLAVSLDQSFARRPDQSQAYPFAHPHAGVQTRRSPRKS
ncbi:hypothetical protein WDW37_15180 [Bdellovibrionota bacterium FG-1]